MTHSIWMYGLFALNLFMWKNSAEIPHWLFQELLSAKITLYNLIILENPTWFYGMYKRGGKLFISLNCYFVTKYINRFNLKI